MRILYVAEAIEVGSASGGSTHVTEVACGLTALGHVVKVIARADVRVKHGKSRLESKVPVSVTRLPQHLALLSLPQVLREVREFKPDVVMERFYNFAGAGVLVAHRRHIPVVLEVNAPIVDPPGSKKTKVDAILLGSMRRWAIRQAKWSQAIVTPLSSTVPPDVTRRKIQELPWGANVDDFDPAIRASHRKKLAELSIQLGLEQGVPVAAFLGSFRAWHGAEHFVEAARQLINRGSSLAFLAIGGGPELEGLKKAAVAYGLPSSRFVFTGPQPHERIPDLLALADIGVAPFDLEAYPPLVTFGFYWSPLKVFEYMAMGLPVVTVDTTPLNEIVRDGKEGLLYKAGDVAGLVRVLDRLADEPQLRRTLGANSRARVTARYSWRQHCVSLERILRGVVEVS